MKQEAPTDAPTWAKWNNRSPHHSAKLHAGGAEISKLWSWIDEYIQSKGKISRVIGECIALGLGLLIRDLTLAQFSSRDPDEETSTPLPHYLLSSKLTFDLVASHILPRCIQLTDKLQGSVNPTVKKKEETEKPSGSKRKRVQKKDDAEVEVKPKPKRTRTKK